MNVFERLEAERALLQSSIVPAWATFRMAVDQLVESYNGIKEGKAHPASIAHITDTCIVVSSHRGAAADHQYTLAITISLTLDQNKYEILLSAEEWAVNPASQQKFRSAKSVVTRFTLVGDPATGATWLSHKSRRVSAFEAAETVLFEALVNWSPEPLPRKLPPPGVAMAPEISI